MKDRTHAVIKGFWRSFMKRFAAGACFVMFFAAVAIARPSIGEVGKFAGDGVLGSLVGAASGPAGWGYLAADTALYAATGKTFVETLADNAASARTKSVNDYVNSHGGWYAIGGAAARLENGSWNHGTGAQHGAHPIDR